jgi:hypothetical protein
VGTGGAGGCPADPLTSITTGCPGELLTLTGAPPSAAATGSMGNGSGTYNSVDCGTADGTERIFRFVAPSSGTVDFLLQHGSYNATFYVRSTCSGGPATLACSDSGKQGTTETISLDVQACQTYYVFSDKRSSCCSTGTYTLTVRYR